MTTLAILLMTIAVPSADAAPSADPVAQPPPASPQRFSHLRRLFGRQSQGPQQKPGRGAGRLVPVPASGTPSATEPSPAISSPEVTTPPVPPGLRQMPAGPADPD